MCVFTASRPGKLNKGIIPKSEKHNGAVSRGTEQNIDDRSDGSTSVTGSTCRRRHVNHNSAVTRNTAVTRGQSLIDSSEWGKNSSSGNRPSEPNLLLSNAYREGSTGIIGSTEVPPGATLDEPCCGRPVKNCVSGRYVDDYGYEPNREKQDCDHMTCDMMESQDVILTGNVHENDGMLDHPITEVTGEILLPNDTELHQTCESIAPTVDGPTEVFKSYHFYTFDKLEMGHDNGTAVNDDKSGYITENPITDATRTVDVAPSMDTPGQQKNLCSKFSVEKMTGDKDIIMGSESEGFSVSASGETECQADVSGNHIEACSRNGPTIFVKQPSDGVDDCHSKHSEERELFSATKQSPQATGPQSQQARRRVCKTAYQRSQENLAQGVRTYPKLEVKTLGAKENLGISSAESDGELTPNSPDSPRVSFYRLIVLIVILISYSIILL